jgi:hypothetical protein
MLSQRWSMDRRSQVIAACLALAASITLTGGSFASCAVAMWPPSNWPAGATEALVLASVRPALDDCTRAEVLHPVNCPQEHSDLPTDRGVQGVRWQLGADPVHGAWVTHWVGDDFQVHGPLVMKVQYVDGSTSVLGWLIKTYKASIRWWGKNGAEVTGWALDDASSSVARDPHFTDQQAVATVRQSLGQCAASGKSSVLECPFGTSTQMPTGYGYHDLQWTLASDPMVNARVSYDDHTAVLHVSGSFTVDLRYRICSDSVANSCGGWSQEHQAGNYLASLGWQAGTYVVIAITKAPDST